MRTLADIGPAKLLADEQDLLRETADALLFSEDAAVESRDAALAMIDRLVASDRWTEERATALRRDLAACGPPALVA